MTQGVPTNLIPTSALIDELIGNATETTVRITLANLAQLLSASGAVADRLQNLDSKFLEDAPIYATRALGLAATSVGEQFKASLSSSLAEYAIYLHDASDTDGSGDNATLIAEIPSTAALSGILDQVAQSQNDLTAARDQVDVLFNISGQTSIFGNPADLSSATSGSAPGNVNLVFDEPILNTNGVVTAVNCLANGSGTAFVRSWTKDGDTFTMFDEQEITVVSGYNSVAVEVDVPFGGYLGFASGGVLTATVTGGNSPLFQSSDGTTAAFTDAAANNTNTFAVQFVATVDEPGDAQISALRDLKLGTDDVAFEPGGSGSAGYRIDATHDFPGGGFLDTVDVSMIVSGNPIIYVYKQIGTKYIPIASVDLGVLDPGTHFAVPVGLTVPPGHFVGVYTPGIANNGDLDQWTQFAFSSSGPTVTDTDLTPVGTPVLITFNCRSADIQVSQGILDAIPAETHRNGARLPAQRVFVGNTGQSLAISTGSTKITTEREFDNVIVYEDASGEPPIHGTLGFCKELLQKENGLGTQDVDYKLIGTTRAVGSQPIAALSKGGATGAFEAMLADITTASPDQVLAITWTQGENDAVLGTTGDTYLDALVQLIDDYNTDIKAITGQTDDVLLIMYQTCSKGSAGVPDPTFEIANAQLRAAQVDPRIVLASPNYFLDFHDGLHHDGPSSKQIGGYYGQALKRIVNDEKVYEPLWPADARIVGNAIDIVFNKPGLVFDTVAMPAQPNNGFVVKDDLDQEVTISSVEIIVPNRVRLTCASTPAVGWKVEYGNVAVSGKPNGYNGLGGNLRDNNGLVVTYDEIGAAMHNWSVVFEWRI